MASVEDKYSDQRRGIMAPGDRCEPITTSNTIPLARSYKRVVVTVGGNAITEDIDATAITWTGLIVGDELPYLPHIIRATGTTAVFAGVFDG